MKKIGKQVILWLFIMVLGCMPVYAAELEQVQKNMVLETIHEVDLLEQPDTAAKAIGTLQAGTPVVVMEDGIEEWCKVASQELTGYIKISELKTLGNQDDLNAEFEKIGNTVQLVFDEIMIRENEEKQARIWGTIIVALIVAIFGVGIVSAIRKNKVEKEEGKS